MITEADVWLDIRSFNVGEQPLTRVSRYIRVGSDTALRIPALGGPPLTFAEIKEASSKVSSAVLEAAIAETAPFLPVSKRTIVDLADAGVPAGVLDVLVVAKTADGEIEVVRSKTEIARVVKGDGLPAGRELTSDEWDIADAIEPGGAAAIAILEHTWVGPLREAIEHAGGHHITAEWTEPEELASWGVSLTT